MLDTFHIFTYKLQTIDRGRGILVSLYYITSGANNLTFAASSLFKILQRQHTKTVPYIPLQIIVKFGGKFLYQFQQKVIDIHSITSNDLVKV